MPLRRLKGLPGRLRPMTGTQHNGASSSTPRAASVSGSGSANASTSTSVDPLPASALRPDYPAHVQDYLALTWESSEMLLLLPKSL